MHVIRFFGVGDGKEHGTFLCCCFLGGGRNKQKIASLAVGWMGVGKKHLTWGGEIVFDV